MLPRIALLVLFLVAVSFSIAGETLPGTQPLTAEGDRSAQMVDGIHRWLARELQRVSGVRESAWYADTRNRETWEKVVDQRRAELAKMLGVVDQRRPGALQIIKDAGSDAPLATGGYSVERIVWPVCDGLNGEGLLLRPSRVAGAAVIALPDADQAPEQFSGIEPGVAPEIQFARRLAERGFLVVVPVLVDRRDDWSGSEKFRRFTNAPHREWIYRQSFELGRTIIGYEIEKVMAAVDALKGPSAKLLTPGAKIGIIGHGEGALIALHAAALDTRLEAAFIHGYFGSRPWEEPLYRNRFASWQRFSDPGVATLIAPRPLGLAFGQGPQVAGPPLPGNGRKGAAPGVISGPEGRWMDNNWHEAKVYRESIGATKPEVCALEDALDGSHRMPEVFLVDCLGFALKPMLARQASTMVVSKETNDERQRRTVRELEEFSQRIFRESEAVRKALPIWTKLKPGAEWDAVQKQARADFWENVIGKLPGDYLKSNPRTRLVHDKEKWRGYEVLLDVQPDVFAWGTLLVPKDLKPGERRPVVVCQHGLEGLPEDTITQDESSPAWKYYKGFAARLCERGFIVYAPHNPYRGGDNFRRIQREANPLGLSLFSFIIAQHDVTTRWLASLPFVDPERIAFYGLSYGGKTAMRVPAALERYCLSICSGDFNEWVLKCVSNTHPASYIFTGEWEIWEWDLAHTFNYAEMALLIAPRPFMVERGHDDGVGLDEHVGYEFAKVKRGYDKLGVGERTEIEWFDGPHTIHGVGTFKFLHKWLRWPEPK